MSAVKIKMEKHFFAEQELDRDEIECILLARFKENVFSEINGCVGGITVEWDGDHGVKLMMRGGLADDNDNG